jgi:hypothetical protein
MNNLMILPGAAGMIALTATMGFVDSIREIGAESFSRGKITLLDPDAKITSIAADTLQEFKLVGTAYLVEILRNEKLSKVVIDAFTGKVLKSTLISIPAR